VRVVLDTNILVRANPKTSPAGLAKNLLLFVLTPPNLLILSPAILAEAGRVFRYPHVQQRWPLSSQAIETYLNLLQESALMVSLPREFPAVVSDPDDDPILQTAIIGQAEVLCSRDVAFRSPAVEEVCRSHGIRVLDDVELIQLFRANQRSE
jgi:putative PIN family toxin of toxin-antitoxin system